MIRSLIRKASVALGCIAMVAGSFVYVATPAQAATISFSDPNCASFSITGTAPNFTLVCASLACSIATNPSSPTPGQSVQFTANCSPTATSVTWSLLSAGGGCPDPGGSTTNPMSLSSAGSALGCVYQVQASSGGLSGQAQTTVSWSSTPQAPPSGCSLNASNTNLPIGGGAVVLTASCAGGGAPTSFAWTGGSLSTPTSTNVQSTSITSTTTFSVTPSNASGNGNTASVTVNVAGTSLGNCGSYSNVLPVVNVTWGQAANWQSTASGNFGNGNNTVWVFKLVVPPGTPPTPTSQNGRFTVSEFNGPTTFRQMTISTTACDFRKKDYQGATGPLAVSNGTTASFSYGVGTPQLIGGVAGLTAGQTYYINVHNWQLDPTPQSSCQQTTCNALMSDAPATP